MKGCIRIDVVGERERERKHQSPLPRKPGLGLMTRGIAGSQVTLCGECINMFVNLCNVYLNIIDIE